jgi:hypothetical protein
MATKFASFQPLGADQGLLSSMLKGQEFGQNLFKFPQEQEQRRLANALNEYKRQYESLRAPNYPDFIKAELEKAQAEPPHMRAQTGLMGAQTQDLNTMRQEKLKELQLKNQMYPELTKAQINMYNQRGQSGFGVGGKEELMFQNFVAKDNPQLQTPEQIYEAANALREGKMQLADGTPLNPLSGAARASLDRITSQTAPAAVRTSMIQANQAESEMNVLQKYAQRGLAPYGTTYFGMSPEQVSDTFKSDKESQKRMGRFIAAQQLNFDIAQQQIKIAQGEAGVTSTEHLMQLAQQAIKAKYPRLSKEARQEAQDYLTEALKEGLNARKRAGISISKAMQQHDNNKNLQNGSSVKMYKNNKEYAIPKNEVNGALKAGYSYAE